MLTKQVIHNSVYLLYNAAMRVKQLIINCLYLFFGLSNCKILVNVRKNVSKITIQILVFLPT